MKILVMCPGSFTNGLDSPERGESRWSQNYAKMLAMAGHEVWAASMGDAGYIQYGCRLINEPNIHRYGPYDIYMDSSWWRDKYVPPDIAKKYVILKWSLEDYLCEDELPPDHYIAYPYPTHKHKFDVARNPYKDRTFPLPTMFCKDMKRPNKLSNRVFLPGKLDKNRPYQKYIDTIIQYIAKWPITGVASDELEFALRQQGQKDIKLWKLIPYDQVMDRMSECRINVPVLAPACTIEATVNGLATIFWQEGEFFPALADNLGLNIKRSDGPEVFAEMFDRLMLDDKHFEETVRISQDYFSCHTYTGALQYFNSFLEYIR